MAPSLKTIEEATAIRHKLFFAFERAECAEIEEEARDSLTFGIVGAGATGMELAGALAEIANQTLRHDFRRINPQNARIILMEGGQRVLTAFPEPLSSKAETERSGKIKVTPQLTIPNYPDIYVLGDLASSYDEQGKPLPGVAQVAMQGGVYAAKAIRAKLEGKKE